MILIEAGKFLLGSILRSRVVDMLALRHMISQE